jgi:NAD(P)-dependent dehydrogenase (short-subunit alcohol dehydrogenase family)
VYRIERSRLNSSLSSFHSTDFTKLQAYNGQEHHPQSSVKKKSEIFLSVGENFALLDSGNGLGFGIASAFIAAGARVVLAGRTESALKAAAERLGPAAAYSVHDITAAGLAGNLVEYADRFGPVSILVNNAGIHLKKTLIDTTEHDFRAVLDTHVGGAFALTRSVASAMLSQARRNILFMASMTSSIGMPMVVAYPAAKSAYLGMVRSLACELSPHGIRVNAIAPGWIESSMLRQALDRDPRRKERILGRTPMGRFGSPEDIGWAAVYLCSAAGRFITGVVLPVDGGASIGF